MFGQSALVPHGSLHCPVTPLAAPLQVAVKPQSWSVRQAPEEPTSALAETWKSLYTTRPHCWFDAAPSGVLNVYTFV